MDEAQVTFWDGLIIASAEQQICSTVLSEDFQDGRQYARWWLASLKSARAIQ
jgi:predicted nucleic acid-binding protein